VEVQCGAAVALAARFGLDYGVVVYTLVEHVAGMVEATHGRESTLAREVRGEHGRLRAQALGVMGGDSELVKRWLEESRVWERLEEVASSGWDWWVEWSGSRQPGSGLLIEE